MPTRNHARCAIGCLVLFLLIGGVLAAATESLPGVSGDNRVASVEPPKGDAPILVLTDRNYGANPFGGYLVEILRGEGLVEFHQKERSALFAAAEPAGALAPYRVVIAAEMEFMAEEEPLLRDYVRRGGLLVAMRPGAELADLFGLRVFGTRPERLIQHFGIDAHAPLAQGVVEEPLQYHGEATSYALDGATALAWLYEESGTPSAQPAVTVHRHGSGSAVAFAFDLAKSVVLMRQGNPDWQNTEGDTLGGYRPMDMFARPDGRTLYDPKRLPIPQADEKQRFLANVILRLAGRPLPRMWYLPGMHKTLMVNTGDAESNHGEELDPAFEACASYGGFYSAYLRHSVRDGERKCGIELTTPQKEAAWRAAGHEIGVHVWAGGPEGAGAYDALHEAYGKIVRELKSKFGHGSRTARNHTIDWTGWVDMAAIEAEFGTGMDVNYYHYIQFGTPLTSYGYFNGTGLPQRFIDAKGRILPIYQATTQWPDEWFADKGMTADETVRIITRMFEAARNGYYSAFVNNIHQVRYNGGSGKDKITPEWTHAVWKYCRDEGIPLWSAEMLLDFVEARNRARFENLAWRIDPDRSSRRLTFDFRTPEGGQLLTIMVPSAFSGRALESIAVDGSSVDFTTEQIKGIEYAMFTTTAAEAGVVVNFK